eukprot:gene5941-6387_t
MTSTALTVRSDASSAVVSANSISNGIRGVENAEFPIVCETCLGDNPYLRMQVDKLGGSCKICDRPFTLFKWRPGREGYKKTEVCQACARLKNLCQCCILDMQLGLPAQLRDAVLQHADGILSAESQKNRDYMVQQQLALLDNSGEMLGEAENEKLLQLARSATQNREQPRVKLVPGKPILPPPNSTISTATQHNNLKRKANEMDNSTGVNLQMATPPPLPPGITDINALSKMNMDRLPDHMRVFLNQHFLKGDKNKQEEQPSNPSIVKEGDGSSRKVSENSKDESQEDVKKKSKKVKLVPKPPAGPPPPSAFQSKAP